MEKAVYNLQEALDAFLKRKSENIYTSYPGLIKTYDPITNTCSIQPLFKKKIGGSSEPQQPPIISEIPLVSMRSEEAIIRFPKESIIGTMCLVVCSYVSIENWSKLTKEKIEPIEPSTEIRHEIDEAFAILSAYPKGIQWEIPQKVKTLEIQVKPGNKISIGDGVNDLIKILFDTLTACETLTVSAFGSPPNNTAIFTALKTQLTNLLSV